MLHGRREVDALSEARAALRIVDDRAPRSPRSGAQAGMAAAATKGGANGGYAASPFPAASLLLGRCLLRLGQVPAHPSLPSPPPPYEQCNSRPSSLLVQRADGLTALEQAAAPAAPAAATAVSAGTGGGTTPVYPALAACLNPWAKAEAARLLRAHQVLVPTNPRRILMNAPSPFSPPI